MADSDLILDQKALTNLLYGGEDEYARFIITKGLKSRFDILKFRPENYAHEPHQHLAEEAKVLLELVKAHKTKEINLKEHLAYIKDVTPYSRTFEVHFNLFKNLALAFSGPKNTQTLHSLIDNMNVIGSVMLQEFDYNTNAVEDTVETIATLEPNSGKFLLTTPLDKAKLCRYYTPHSTHVIIFARIRTSPTSTLSAPYPFLIQLRDPTTFDLAHGVTMKWLGPSFGGISGREYAFQFKEFPVDADKLLLDKFVTYSNRQLVLQDTNDILNYTTRMCLLLEQDQNVEKSIREALKAAFLTVRYANNRTQFQTMDEKGKERPIFEYNYNKTRIMKGLTEMLNLEFVWSTLRKEILTGFLNFQKNPKKMTDMFIFYDMFEAHVNERCLIVIESFRESIGGIGFLKYSGVPTLQENALKNAAYTGPTKELRYLRFAQFFVNIDLKKPGDFISHFAGWLSKGPEFNDMSPQNDFHQRVDFFDYYLSKKLLFYRQKVINNHSIPAVGDHKTILNGISNFENITRLCETFITHLKPFSLANMMNASNSQTNKQLLLTVLAVDIITNILDDVPFYLAHEGKAWPKNSLNDFNDLLARYIDQLGKKSVEIVESFGFDEVLLHSCICKTADETYETMLRMSKYHNPRNDPKVQEEIRKDLIAFLNRPPNPKL